MGTTERGVRDKPVLKGASRLVFLIEPGPERSPLAGHTKFRERSADKLRL